MKPPEIQAHRAHLASFQTQLQIGQKLASQASFKTRSVTVVDWRAWHDDYHQPDSVLSQRLRIVRHQIRQALDDCPPGPIRVISLCAGQGHDLLGALAHHSRRQDVTARLVELDAHNAAIARRAALAAGLHRVEVVTGDAALTRHYHAMVPAHLVLACGVFGNISNGDIERTLASFPQLCAHGAALIWTRHRHQPDQVPWICRRLEQAGFQQHWLSEPHQDFAVGVHRFTGQPQPLDPTTRMFTFIGYDLLTATTPPCASQ